MAAKAKVKRPSSERKARSLRKLTWNQVGKLPDGEFGEAAIQKLSSEKAVLTDEVVCAIEKFIAISAPTRRVALACLTKPWLTFATQFSNDREAALSGAIAERGIEDIAGNYEQLAHLLRGAQHRLLAALVSTRDDWDDIKKETERTYQQEVDHA